MGFDEGKSKVEGKCVVDVDKGDVQEEESDGGPVELPEETDDDQYEQDVDGVQEDVSRVK